MKLHQNLNQNQNNQTITEKKFVNSHSSEKLNTFRQVKHKMHNIPSYSTIFYDRENTQSIESELKNTPRQPELDSTLQHKTQQEQEHDTDALTYSRTASLQAIEDILPLLKKIIKLLSSKQHIASHVSHSLGVKGYQSELSTEIGKIVANSFNDYIAIADTLSSKLTRQDFIDKDDKILGLNREIATLKMENAKLYERNTTVEQQNHRLKRKYQKIKSTSKLSNVSQCREQALLTRIEQEVGDVFCRMDSFESQVYQQLGLLQNTLLQVSNFRNDLVHSQANNLRWKDECQKYQQKNNQLQKLLQIKQTTIEKYILKENINKNKQEDKNTTQHTEIYKKIAEELTTHNQQLKTQIAYITEELNTQKQLYDQMLDKNIALEKQIYFLSQTETEQKTNSLTITEPHQELTLTHHS